MLASDIYQKMTVPGHQPGQNSWRKWVILTLQGWGWGFVAAMELICHFGTSNG